MIKYEDECVGCPPEMGCIGDSCKYRRVPHYYCDECDKEFSPENLFVIDGDMICENCAREGGISYRELLEDRYGTLEV